MAHPKNGDALPFLLKNVPNWANTALLAVFLLGHRRFWDERTFLSRNPIVQRRTTIVSERFGKNVHRAGIWGRF